MLTVKPDHALVRLNGHGAHVPADLLSCARDVTGAECPLKTVDGSRCLRWEIREYLRHLDARGASRRRGEPGGFPGSDTGK